MKKYLRSLVLLMCSSVGLSACVSSSGQDDINNLYQRVNQHDQQIKALSQSGPSSSSMLSGQAEMWAQMQSMRQDLNMVKGQLDEMNMGGGGGLAQLQARTARLETAMRQMASELGMKVEALDAPDMPAAPGAAGGTPAAGQAQPGVTTTAQPGAAGSSGAGQSQTAAPAEAQEDKAAALYEAGTKAFGSKRYRDGIKIFDELVTAYPKHNLAGNAYFWQGECYFQLGDYARAALAYNNVLEKFPGSAKYQSSMLKQGMALYSAGKKDGGKVRLNELIAKYPKSAEAERARKFLKANP